MSDDRTYVEAFFSIFGISGLAAAARTFISEDRRSLIAFLRGLIMASFVSVLTALFIQDYNLSVSMQGAVIGIAAFVADDILLVVLAIAKNIRNRPENIFNLFFNGKK